MKKYEVITIHDCTGSEIITWRAIYNTEIRTYFGGYDFMGGVNWVDTPDNAELFAIEAQAKDVINDLKAADYDEQFPAGKRYLLKTKVYGEEMTMSLDTANRIAEIYDMDCEADIFCHMEVWDVENEPKQVDLLDLVSPILERKAWMEREYRDYCENERY